MIFFSILIFPANIWAIYKFYQQKLNKMFFILVTALCINNFAMVLLGLLDGTAKFTNNHPFGYAGCIMSLSGGPCIGSFTMIVQAILSYERRKVATTTTIFTFHFRVYVMLFLGAIYSVVFWTIVNTSFGGASYLKVKAARNSTETFFLCSTGDFGFPGSFETTFTLIGFGIPSVVIVYNYW